MGTGIFEGLGSSGGGGGGGVLGLSQYHKKILMAVRPTTSKPMAVNCADHPLDSDVPSASLCFFSLSRASLASCYTLQASYLQ